MNWRDKQLEREHELAEKNSEIQILKHRLQEAENQPPADATLQMPVAGDDPDKTKPLTLKRRSNDDDGLGGGGFVIPINIVAGNNHPNVKVHLTPLASVTSATRLLTPTSPGTGGITVSDHTIELGYCTVGDVHKVIYFSDGTYVRSDHPDTAYYNGAAWDVVVSTGDGSFTPKLAVLKADSTFTTAALIVLEQTASAIAASASKSVATGTFSGTMTITISVDAYAIKESFTLSTLTYNIYDALSKESIGTIATFEATVTPDVAWGDVGGVTPDGTGSIAFAETNGFNLDVVRNFTPSSGTIYGVALDATMDVAATGDLENEAGTLTITIPNPRVSNKPFALIASALT